MANASSSSASGQSSDINASPPYWHEDGDIILRVKERSTNKDHRFRIHRFILTVNSPVFRDMMTLGSKNASKEGEVPIVDLQDDSVADVRALIMVLYKGFVLLDKPEAITFEVAIGVLRLSHKYELDDLYTTMKGILLQSWPLDREAYKQFKAKFPTSKARLRMCVELINTGWRTGAHELLPIALFELAEGPGDNADIMTDLSAECLARLWIGKHRIIKRLELAFHPVGPGVCTSIHQGVSQCDAKRKILLQLVAYQCIRQGKLLEIYEGVTSAKLFGQMPMGTICDRCITFSIGAMKAKALEILDSLNEDFNLTSPNATPPEPCSDPAPKRLIWPYPFH